jgi:hypothetical protein
MPLIRVNKLLNAGKIMKVTKDIPSKGRKRKLTFLRQNYLEQVPGVETHFSFLSADSYRLPQPTTAFCTGFQQKISRLR